MFGSDYTSTSVIKPPTILLLVCVTIAAIACSRQVDKLSSDDNQASRSVTFNEVAPTIWNKCASCHRAEESVPFPLITYQDIDKRQKQILEVLQSGYMPPWLPSNGRNVFANDTRLSEFEFTQLTNWLRNGSPPGDPKRLPTKPAWTSGWRLGKPDLVVSMSKPFRLPTAGQDVYRNFVIPIPLDRMRYVRAMEFRPGNASIVHHAFMLTDPMRRLRKLDGTDGQPGFAGMDTKEAQSPDGHFIGWQPGRAPYEAPAGMAWKLFPNTDLVLQVHMQCSGKPEQIQSSIGLYFTDIPPQRIPVKVDLRSQEIDIPAGIEDYTIEDNFTVPVAVELMAVAPHAHYLGKEMYGWAELPNGTRRELLTIKNWDLNWQSEYRFKQWIALPAGTTLHQRFVYDNSSANIRNPNRPPAHVRYGPQATDEMGSLWFQMVARTDSERNQLLQGRGVKLFNEIIKRETKNLTADQDNLHANIELGKVAIAIGQLQRGLDHFRRAANAHPTSADAHYYYGHCLMRMNRLSEGAGKLGICLTIDPEYLQAHYDLGHASLLARKFQDAEEHFRAALRINQYDARTLKQLGTTLIASGNHAAGLVMWEKAIVVGSEDDSLSQKIATLKSQLAESSEGVE